MPNKLSQILLNFYKINKIIDILSNFTNFEKTDNL